MTDINIQYVDAENIRPAEWRVTYILRPDFKILERSIDSIGIRYPILARDEDSTIIDGHARWLVAQKLGIKCPVVFVSCDETDAKLIHIEMNRGGGFTVAAKLSDLIIDILMEGDYDDEELRIRLSMSIDEFEILVDGSLIKRKELKDYKYNKAWVPIESKEPAEAVVIERPKTPDR